MSNFKIFDKTPSKIIKIKKDSKGDKHFSVEMIVKDELSHIAIMELRDFLKETGRFVGTFHSVKVFNVKGKKVDQTTLYII